MTQQRNRFVPWVVVWCSMFAGTLAVSVLDSWVSAKSGLQAKFSMHYVTDNGCAIGRFVQRPHDALNQRP